MNWSNITILSIVDVYIFVDNYVFVFADGRANEGDGIKYGW